MQPGYTYRSASPARDLSVTLRSYSWFVAASSPIVTVYVKLAPTATVPVALQKKAVLGVGFEWQSRVPSAASELGSFAMQQATAKIRTASCDRQLAISSCNRCACQATAARRQGAEAAIYVLCICDLLTEGACWLAARHKPDSISGREVEEGTRLIWPRRVTPMT